MNLIPDNAQEINLEGATVSFYKYSIDNTEYIQFDSSKCGHPEPMINAMVGLENLKDTQKLVMINSKAPMGLFPKVENNFSWEVEEIDNIFKITFSKKGDTASDTDFDDRACNG